MPTGSAPRAAPPRRAPAVLVLAAALAAVVVGVGVALGLGATDQHGDGVVRFVIHSRLVHRALPVTAVTPPGVPAGRPLVVFLHGKGVDGQDSNLNEAMFAALARLGRRAPVIVFPNGGEDSYWHNRAGGAWGDYVVREVIPAAIRRFGVDPRRVAIGGISMGGFGALDLARLQPGRFCAVGGHSAALWTQAGDTAPGAFDSAADFARHDVIRAAAGRDPYQGMPIWLDVGTQDPFRAADTRLARELRGRPAGVAFHVWPGAHEGAYWRAHWAAYVGFYAAALARCQGAG